MAITLHKADGFEHGIAGTTYVNDQTPTGTPTIVTTGQRSGLRALQINPSGAAEHVLYNSAASVVSCAFWIYFTSVPAATGSVILRIRRPTTTENGNLEWDGANQKFRLDAGAGSPVVGGPTITTGTWYRVVIEYDCTTTTGTLRCRVDTGSGGTEWSATGTIVAGNCSDVTLGASGTATYDMLADDFVLSITDGDYEQLRDDWSDWEILSAIPTSDGTHNITTSGDFDSFTGTAFSNSTTNGNTFIGHRPLQAANTADQVIRQELGTTANYMEVLFENPSNTHPNVGGVQTHAGHTESAASGASLGEIRLLLSDNTVVNTTGAIDVINSTEDPGTAISGKKRAAVAPSGGWDETKVDGLKARIGFADGAPDVNFIDLMLQVVYYAAPAVGATNPGWMNSKGGWW